jgi:hypothetical protein
MQFNIEDGLIQAYGKINDTWHQFAGGGGGSVDPELEKKVNELDDTAVRVSTPLTDENGEGLSTISGEPITTKPKNDIVDLIENNITVTQIQTSGTEIAQVKIGDNTAISLYAPSGGGGTTVVPNPTGTAVANLNSIQIGNDIYSIPSGGGGNVGYEESVIYNTPTSSTGLITTLDFSDADFLIFESGIYASDIYQKFENIISAETFKQEDVYFIGGEVTDYSEYFGIKYINNTTIEIVYTGRQKWSEQQYLYKISKGKFVSGSTPSPSSDNGYYKETELYSSASSSASIALSDNYTNYDALIFLNKYNFGGYILDSIVSTTGIKEAANNNCQFRIHCGSDSAYIFGAVTSNTQFALTMQNYFVTKVIGINYTNRT